MEVWYHGALRSLDRKLKTKYGPGAQIVFLEGPYTKALKKVCLRQQHAVNVSGDGTRMFVGECEILFHCYTVAVA